MNVCTHCGRTVTRGAGGYLRDDDPDPGDGLGGDASCHARPPINGRMQPHELPTT